MTIKTGVILDLLEVMFGRAQECVPIMMIKCFLYLPVEYRRFFGVHSGVEPWSTETTNHCYVPMKF